MADESVFRARIIAHEWQHASVSVKKVAAALYAFLREAQQGGLDGAARCYDKVLQEMQAFEFALTRADAVAARCREETAQYRALHADIDRQVSATCARLGELKDELEAAKLERTRKQQYEEIARDVNKRPSRAALHAAIDSVHDDLKGAVAERAALDAKLASRRAQFQLLFSAIADLQRTFVDEAAEEARLGAAAAAARALGAAAAAGDAAADQLKSGVPGGDAGDEDADADRAAGREAASSSSASASASPDAPAAPHQGSDSDSPLGAPGASSELPAEPGDGGGMDEAMLAEGAVGGDGTGAGSGGGGGSAAEGAAAQAGDGDEVEMAAGGVSGAVAAAAAPAASEEEDGAI